MGSVQVRITTKHRHTIHDDNDEDVDADGGALIVTNIDGHLYTNTHNIQHTAVVWHHVSSDPGTQTIYTRYNTHTRSQIQQTHAQLDSSISGKYVHCVDTHAHATRKHTHKQTHVVFGMRRLQAYVFCRSRRSTSSSSCVVQCDRRVIRLVVHQLPAPPHPKNHRNRCYRCVVRKYCPRQTNQGLYMLGHIGPK